MRIRVAIASLIIVGLIAGLGLARGASPAAPAQITPTSASYLPLVRRDGAAPATTPTTTIQPSRIPTATRTPTATPTRTPVPVTLLGNGDFEQGALHWIDSGSITSTLPVMAHSGTHAIWFHGADGGEVDRDITVPLDKPYLSYWIWIRSNEPTCGDDRGGVSFSAATPFLVDSFDLCATTTTDRWVNRVVDLSAVAGQTGTLVLIAGTFDGDLTGSELLIDDVGFRSVP